MTKRRLKKFFVQRHEFVVAGVHPSTVRMWYISRHPSGTGWTVQKRSICKGHEDSPTYKKYFARFKEAKTKLLERTRAQLARGDTIPAASLKAARKLAFAK